MREQLSYRADIDGLRAIAVLAVIIYHTEKSWLPGGYLGVDVFFVISGYLITSILYREISGGTFSIWRFYERRARRILPALSIVLLACLPFAWLLMDAGQLRSFGQSLVAQALFASNILFWKEAGYFAEPSLLKPLLHTWSLAVEEQFYLFFPVVMWALIRLRMRLILALALAFAASLCAAHLAAYKAPSAGFFLLPFRAWELLAGSVCALAARRHLPFWASPLAAASLLASFWLFNEATAHPSLLTSIPVAATAVLIFDGRESLVKLALSIKALTWTGLISYSLYLWHAPLLVFARLANLGTLPFEWLWWLGPLLVTVSFLTWRFVETPARSRQKSPLVRLAPALSIAWLAPLLIGLTFHLAVGFPSRLSYPETLEATFHREGTEGTCFENPKAEEKPTDWYCEIGARDSGIIDLVLFGDSHAYSALPAVRRYATEYGVRAIAITDAGCPPVLGVRPERSDQNETDCQKLNERVVQLIRENSPAKVIMAARWTYYTDFSQFLVAPDGTTPRDFSGRLSLLKEATSRTVEAISGAGSAAFILGQVPMQKYGPREIYKALYLLPAGRSERLASLSVSRVSDDAMQVAVEEMLMAIPSSTYIDPTSAFCNETACMVGDLETSYYFNPDHLSSSGALVLLPMITEAIGADARQSESQIE